MGDRARVSRDRAERWSKEAEFFDEVAARAQVEPIDPLELARYAPHALRRRFSREFKLGLLGDLRDKRILDLGCGDGHNAVLFARLGAKHAAGIDIAPKAIELAVESARVNGVADRCRFVCAPIETAEFEPGEFDVVYCQGILHHLIDELEPVMAQVRRWTRPGGLIVFTEPTNLNPLLRRIRFLVPVKTEHTDDERPLERAELERIRPFFRHMHLRHFYLTGRLDRFILTKRNYERSSLPRRLLVNLSYTIDWTLLSLPIFETMGSVSVIHGSPAD